MFRFILAGLILTAALAGSDVSGTLLGGAEAHEVYGVVEIDSTEGQFILRYDLIISGFVPDSVKVFGVLPDYQQLSLLGIPTVETRGPVGRIAYRLAGEERLASDSGFLASCNLAVFGMEGTHTVQVWRSFRTRSSGVSSLANIFGWGYGTGELARVDNRKALFCSGELGLSVHTSKVDIFAQAGGLTNFRKRWQFSLSEYQLLGLRLFASNQSSTGLALSAAVQYSRVTVRRKSAELVNGEWGGQFEARLDGLFERVYYSYSTNHDGYHKAGVAFFKESGGLYRLGTRYELILIDKVTMFRVQLQLEGMGWDDTETRSLMRENTRPWWHKGLALGSTLPFLPIAGVVKLVQIVF